MVQPTIEHFERAAREIASHGDNDTLPFDLDVRFVGDNSAQLAAVAFNFYSGLKSGKIGENKKRLHGMRVYNERLVAPSGATGFRVVTKIQPFWNMYLNGLAIAIAEKVQPSRDERACSYHFLPTG